MYEAFLKHLQTSGMADLIRSHKAVLVAYSGGADSTLLLQYLHRFCQAEHLSLYAAHVNHGIRGTDADRDEAHCRRIADALSLHLYIANIDVPALAAQTSKGLEECARAERYAFFDQVCAALGNAAMPIATAHHGDDQLETVLFHWVRGSGLTGVAGIRPIRDQRYIRPLLPFSAEEIRSACQKEQYEYVIDETNADTTYTRNYIRHIVVPALKKLNPNLTETARRMSDLFWRDEVYLTEKAADYVEKGDGMGYAAKCSREKIRRIGDALAARALRLGYGYASPQGSLTMEQTETLLLAAKETHAAVRRFYLPGNVQAEVSRDAIVFYTDVQYRQKAEEGVPDPLEIPLLSPDTTYICDWKHAKIVLTRKNFPFPPENYENIYKLFIQEPMNFATIKGVLRLRTLAPGDTIRLHGMTKKVRKLFSEKKCPTESRLFWPILTDAEEILWVPGITEPCDKVRSGKNSDFWVQIFME